MAFDLVIRNGLIVDGTGSPAREGDVAVEGDKIVAISKGLGAGKEEIDARGKVISPGFVDAHTHMDLFLVRYPHGNPVVNHGVTTVVIGDCGASAAPIPDGTEPVQVLVNYLKRVMDDYVDAKDFKWKSFRDYQNYLRGRVGINAVSFVPHSPVRLSVMGEDAYKRESTPEELEAMKQLTREMLEAGYIGFSSSPRGGPEIHAGTPSTFASQDEIVELANLAGEYGGSFQFNGYDKLLVEESGFPRMVERIHANLIGNEFRIHPGVEDEGARCLKLMADASGPGKFFSGVVIPYTHIRRFDINDVFFLDGLPAWEAIKAAGEGLPAKLADKDVRRKIEQERINLTRQDSTFAAVMPAKAPPGEPYFPSWHGWDAIVFDPFANNGSPLAGKSVGQIARETGEAPVDVFFDNWLKDDLRTKFIYYGWANDDLEALGDMIKDPHGLIGTDTGAHLDRFFWHGSPVKVLSTWTREKGLLSLEEAVQKLTSHPADLLGLRRGRLAEGWPADITVFDPDTIEDLVSERLPAKVDDREVERHPKGIQAVVVNGKPVVREGQCLDVFPGKVTKQELNA